MKYLLLRNWSTSHSLVLLRVLLLYPLKSDGYVKYKCRRLSERTFSFFFVLPRDYAALPEYLKPPPLHRVRSSASQL